MGNVRAELNSVSATARGVPSDAYADNWQEELARMLRDSGYVVSERYIKFLLRERYFGTTTEEVAATADSILCAIELGKTHVLAYFLPPTPVFDRDPQRARHGWARQYDRCRTTLERRGGLSRKQTPPLAAVSDVADRELWQAYAEGVSGGFYTELRKLAPNHAVSPGSPYAGDEPPYEPGFFIKNIG